MTLTFDLWPWPFAWTSLLSLVITPENFVMIRWWKHSQKVWQTDIRTENTVHRAAWSQLKMLSYMCGTECDGNMIASFRVTSLVLGQSWLPKYWWIIPGEVNTPKYWGLMSNKKMYFQKTWEVHSRHWLNSHYFVFRWATWWFTQ